MDKLSAPNPAKELRKQLQDAEFVAVFDKLKGCGRRGCMFSNRRWSGARTLSFKPS